MQTTLSNGMQVILQENHAAPVVALQVWVGVGSADEVEGEEGLAHVFEHMLFKGTRNRGVGEIAADVEAAGGDINAWTSFDQTVYHIVLSSRELSRGVEILSDAIRHSTFDPEELEKERLVILEEIKRSRDMPSRVISQELFSLAYQDHPYRRPVLGKEEVIRNLTRENLVRFFEKWYTPDNMIFVAVGDFKAEEALVEVEKYFGEGFEGKAPQNREHLQEKPQKSPRVKAILDNVQEAHLDIAFHIPPFLHEDTAALDLAAVILGQGESARLSLEVKRALQVVNDAYAYAYTPKEPGLFMVSASLPPEHLEEAVRALLFQVYRLREEPVTPDELEKARAMLESDAVYQKETMQGQARKLGYFAQLTGDPDYERQYLAAVARVTPQDILRVANTYLTPENLSLATLVPASEEALAKPEVAKEESRALETKLAEHITRALEETKETFAVKVDALETRALIREVLDNGTVLLVQRAPEVPLVALRAVYVGGLLYEDEENNGINYLLARMLTKGTPSRSANDIAREFDEMAGSIGGFSGRNSFGLRAEFLSKHFERATELFAECLLYPTFAENELETERRQVLEEIRNREDNPAGEAYRLFAQTLYSAHPYRMDVSGTAESVRGITREQLKEYFEEKYPAQNLVVAIVGDIDPERALVIGRRLFGGRPKTSFAPPKLPKEPPREKAVTAFKYLDKSQAHLVMGFPGLTLRDPDRFAVEVLSAILSGQGGRLFTELRDKQSLAYSVYAMDLEGIDPGYFSVYMATSPERIPEAIEGIRAVLEELIREEVPAKELARAKRYLIGTHDISLQRSSAIASVISFNEVYGLGAEAHKDYAAQIEAVTAEDVLRVAKKYLTLDKYTLAIVKPEKVAAEAAAQ